MNLEEIKLSGKDTITVNDSLNTSLISFKLVVDSSTIIPDDEKLIIYVEGSDDKKRTYEYILNNKLSLNDYFCIEPKYINNEVVVKTYTKDEEFDSNLINLYSGYNKIYTNYSNASLEVVYPKDCDLVKYFLNNSLYSLNNNSSNNLTNSQNGVNGLFNNIDINCLTSRNNKFRIDSEGNLYVNSITSNINNNNNVNMDMIYPIGSIYMNINDTNPSILFGGSWEQIQDRFLLGCSSTYTAGSLGGEATHKLTVAEMPSHKHSTRGQWMTSGSSNRCVAYQDISTDPVQTKSAIQNTGGNKAHNNMPPYLAVYIWKRVA